MESKKALKAARRCYMHSLTRLLPAPILHAIFAIS